MEKLLPVGTIVKARLTEKAAVRMMIVGYYPQSKVTEKLYDYAAIPYPMGMTFKLDVQGLNHGAILAVEALGYQDQESDQFLQSVPILLDALQKKVEERCQQLEKEGQQRLQEEKTADHVDEWFV